MFKVYSTVKYKTSLAMTEKSAEQLIIVNLRDIPNMEVADNQHAIISVRPSAFSHH